MTSERALHLLETRGWEERHLTVLACQRRGDWELVAFRATIAGSTYRRVYEFNDGTFATGKYYESDEALMAGYMRLVAELEKKGWVSGHL